MRSWGKGQTWQPAWLKWASGDSHSQSDCHLAVERLHSVGFGVVYEMRPVNAGAALRMVDNQAVSSHGSSF